MPNGLSAIGVLKGTLSGEHYLKGKIQNGGNLKGKFSFASGCNHEPYDGDYIVDPTFDKQVLETQSKLMLENVEVNPIEVSRVSNPSGGTTVYIGGLING